MPWNKFFLKVYDCSRYGGVGGSPVHVPFSLSQLLAVLQLPRRWPRSCWSALSNVAPEENSLGFHQEMQTKATPLQGTVMRLLRQTHISICSSYAGPVLSAVASTEIPVRCSQVYFHQFLGWKMIAPPQVRVVTSPPSQFLWLQTFRIEFSRADPSLRMFLGWFWYQGWS